MTEPSPDDVERFCIYLHEAYENAAAENGWATQQASRKPWSEVPEANKATMRHAVARLVPVVEKRMLDRVLAEIAEERDWQAMNSRRSGTLDVRLTHRYTRGRLDFILRRLQEQWGIPSASSGDPPSQSGMIDSNEGPET